MYSTYPIPTVASRTALLYRSTLRDFALFGEESRSISRGLFTFENILYLSRKTPQKNSNSAVCLLPVSRRVASLCHWLIDTIVLCVMPLSGWGKCCTWVDCTTLGRERFDLGPKPRVDFQNHERLPKEGILDMEWEKAHFQENTRGYLAREHFTRCGDHRTLPLAEKICDRMDFLAANRLRVDKFESPARNGVEPWLRLMKVVTVKTNKAQNDEMSPKNTQRRKR